MLPSFKPISPLPKHRTRLYRQTLKAFGDNIDILVNNAGVLTVKAITETTPEDYAQIFDVNVRAPLLMTKAVVPHLRAPGRIINMSSVGSKIGPPKMALYAGSKAAIEGITRSLAQELGDAGHTVNAKRRGAWSYRVRDAGRRTQGHCGDTAQDDCR
jgi:3-oxoacyl-[acyl-carrier protein] reductase